MRKTVTILTMPVDVISIYEASAFIENLTRFNEGSYICISNVHMCMETVDNTFFRHIVTSSSLVLPDGRPLVWAQRLLGYEEANQVRGCDLFKLLCAKSISTGINVGLYGCSSQAELDCLANLLTSEFPGIRITYMFSPPFRPLTPDEDDDVVSEIEHLSVDILFVGLGCPKQEFWMFDHKDKLSCVMIGVGAVFDFVTGEKKQAPRWIQLIGLEWLFRLMCEPTRLWRRYLILNPRFIWSFFQQLLFRKNSP